jgi:hypothetical protein
LHWVLDIAFDEENCRVRKDHGLENFALLRHIALNLFKHEKTCKRGIQGKRLLAGWNQGYLLKILAGFSKMANLDAFTLALIEIGEKKAPYKPLRLKPILLKFRLI